MFGTKRFHMVLHNYSYDDIEDIQTVFEQKCDYYIIGREYAPKMHIKHLQMYAEFSDAITFKNLKLLFPETVRRRIHMEVARASAEANVAYCSKQNDYICVNCRRPSEDRRDEHICLERSEKFFEEVRRNEGDDEPTIKNFERA